MTNKKKIIIRTLVIIGVFIGAAFIGLNSLMEGMCKNDILEQIPSPNKKLEAIIFQRDCGATTGFSTQVSIINSSRNLPKGGGNVFVADTDHGKAPSGQGGPEVHAKWQNDKSLIIKYHKDARTFKTASMVKGINISYEKFKSQPTTGSTAERD